ncbi:hypothetical protein HIM_06494 [Hirsutella minnesotensis 3608]|uniref:Uncharacterized protein n=1 Tax=Hirsutella minnesotensis 3608 TaxID=1043627 RepID=A0A0F7ZNN2_9HYPO|nr:hypothetical protein HIM_06494 [Hirsutella minnesotensis 3608]
MPRFFDSAQIHHALRNQAMPIIDALSANQKLRDRALSRFERDDPPPYASSTESEDPSPDYHEEPKDDEPLPDDVRAVIDLPLTDKELSGIAFELRGIGSPIQVYYNECQAEVSRLQRSRCLRMRYGGERPVRRFGVLIRRNVKRRFQKLGIWDPDWGFPGRNAQPNDDAAKWTWWWQSESEPVDWPGKEVALRALSLRQNLRRGESAPVPPRSCLRPDASVSEADSFMISRPWFVFAMELQEERTRWERLWHDSKYFFHTGGKTVCQWWRDRGDWRDEFDERTMVNSWKWRHESPSPEPEDYATFEPTDSNPNDPLDDIELTPSEVDALEAIDLPRSEQPKKFWAVYPFDSPPFFPGHMLDSTGGRTPPPMDPIVRLGPDGQPLPTIRLFESPPEEESAWQRPQESPIPSESQQETPRTSPPRERRQLRNQRSERTGMDLDRNYTPPPPRRSARIAMKRAAESLPSEAAPKKRSRPTTTKTTTAKTPAPQSSARQTRRDKITRVSARPPATTNKRTRLSRGRGGPRSDTRLEPSSTARRKTREETKVNVRTRSGRGRGT